MLLLLLLYVCDKILCRRWRSWPRWRRIIETGCNLKLPFRNQNKHVIGLYCGISEERKRVRELRLMKDEDQTRMTYPTSGILGTRRHEMRSWSNWIIYFKYCPFVPITFIRFISCSLSLSLSHVVVVLCCVEGYDGQWWLGHFNYKIIHYLALTWRFLFV